MIDLAQLKNTSRPRKKGKRLGRGIGSSKGLTCGRGGKGDSARQGYRKRFGYEGGQVPLYRKLPIRGFTRGRFVKASCAIGLSTIDAHFEDGETVSMESLREKGLIVRRLPGGIKILANGDLTKKVKIEVHAISEGALKKIQSKAITFTAVK
jgi:large subunit ribosomal protein L15